MKMLSRSIALVLVASSLVLLIRGSDGFAPTTNLRALRRSETTGELPPNLDHHRVRNSSTRQSRHGHSATSIYMIRGGAAALSVSKPLIAKLCAGYTGIFGASLLLAPISFLKTFHNIDIEKDSLEVYLARASGAISIGVSVNIYLSLVENMAAQRAIGVSLLARFLYVLKSSLIGQDLTKLGGSKQFLSTNEVVMAWTTFSLLTGAGNPIVSAKLFSCLAFLKGSFLTFKPVAAANKFLGIDVSKEGMEKSRGLCRTLGNHLMTSALFMGTLAFGVDPFKGAGYTSLLWVALLADMTSRDKTYLLFGDDSNSRTEFLVDIVISGLCAVGFLT